MALADGPKHQPTAQRSRDPEAAGHRLGVLPRLGLLRPAFEGADHRCAPGRLHRVEAWQGVADPTGVPKLVEGLPHPDEPRATASWINDRGREMPVELLRQLEAHGLLALDPVRLPEG